MFGATTRWLARAATTAHERSLSSINGIFQFLAAWPGRWFKLRFCPRVRLCARVGQVELAIDWLSVTRQAAPNPDGFSSSTAARLSGLTQTVSPSKPRARGKLALALGRRFTGSGEQFCPRLVVGFDKSGHIECRASLKRLDGRDGT